MASHKPDDYNAPKILARKELQYHLSKLQETNFSQRVRPRGLFNKDQDVYDINVDVKKPVKEVRPITMAEHDKPFYPSKPPKVGINKTLSVFPEYKENPLKFCTRKRPVEGEEEKPCFKKTHNFKSRPSPSIQTNVRNLKASFPSVFRKWEKKTYTSWL